MGIRRSNLGLLIIFFLVAVISFLSKYYIDWLWFKSVNFQSVFTTTLLSKLAVWFCVFLITFAIVWINLFFVLKYKNNKKTDEDPEDVIYFNNRKKWNGNILQGKYTWWIVSLGSLVVAFIISAPAGYQWIVVQQFLKRVPFGLTDPIFNKDIGFYAFNLSFYQFVYNILMSVLIFTAIIVAVAYFLEDAEELLWSNWKEFSFPKSHIAILVALILALKAWGYNLSAYSILFSADGIVYGATYTDIHARLLTYKILMLVTIILALIIIVNIFIKRLSWIVYSVVAWLVVSVLLGSVYPTIVQKMVVQPNEFNREKPYLENAIAYTQSAYQLDQVDNQEFSISYDLTKNDIAENSLIIDNIRLWDWQPLKDTYKSLQELRPYYVFNDVDIDRYTVNGEYRQVMLSAREMEDLETNEALSAQTKTWVNQRLFYTHGYGVVMSPVNEVAQEGFPNFFIKDIPPQFTTDIEVSSPQIYFGERTNSYVVVNTKQQEFDYPMGEQNVYTNYSGQNGIKIHSFMRRLLLSWELKDYKIILSSDINNDSQILMNRNIMERTKKIAPYLMYDNDPYIVINSEGKLYWMIDGYTYSNKYPYSQPFNEYGHNYIRNAVKVICDAYTGEMQFYVADPNDPLIKAYEKIFPGVYLPLSSMPDDLKSHIRYPADLFQIQANIYRIYHMSDPGVFYNKEDSWVIPNEVIGNKEQAMEPYYVITKLPGETKEEYILMLPYNPNGRPNMNAWMCARMDGDNYGKIVVFRFPKQETVYGPMQIESRINQDTEISQQLTLWNQSGTSVYRGNLLVIPIENSVLYIEPLYLQAEKSRMPELKRVIASYGNTIVMENSLQEALTRIFGKGAAVSQPDSENEVDSGVEQNVQQLAALARQYYDEANQALKNGEWAVYGEKLNQLNDIIRRLENAVSLPQ